MTTTPDADHRSVSVACGRYVINCIPSGLPLAYNELKRHAALVDEVALHEPGLSCVSVRRSGESWPFLLVAQSCELAAGFAPGVLLALETNVLFVGDTIELDVMGHKRTFALRAGPLQR